MYHVVIVDDERKVCNLILELGDWKRLQIEVDAVCTDGEEALAVILEKKPDIVLTDVRMPVYDGLELIRRASEAGIEAAFIIISGYRYFEYAYHAFKYGVIDYLLKPIDERQLNDVLEKTCRMLARRRQLADAEDEIRRLAEHVEIGNRRKLFENLFDEAATFPVTAEELEERYQKNFPYACLRVFFLKTGRSFDRGDSLVMSKKIYETGKRVFASAYLTSEEQKIHTPCIEVIHGGIGGILNFTEKAEPVVRRLLDSFFYEVRETAEMFGTQPVTIGLGPIVRELTGLPMSAALAERAETAKVVLGANRIIDLAEFHFSRLTAEQFLTDAAKRNLRREIEILSDEGVGTWMDRMAEAAGKRPPLTPEVLFAVRQEVENELLRAAGEERREETEKFFADLTEETNRADSPHAFFSAMKEAVCGRIAEWRREKDAQERLPIRLAKAYIAERYAEAVTLESVAEAVGLSPAYFSTSFRQYEGRTFSEYLTSVRMEAAKQLLSGTNLTHAAIAARVGYADDKYFVKVFKKEVGIRPKEYRRLYGTALG